MKEEEEEEGEGEKKKREKRRRWQPTREIKFASHRLKPEAGGFPKEAKEEDCRHTNTEVLVHSAVTRDQVRQDFPDEL